MPIDKPQTAAADATPFSRTVNGGAKAGQWAVQESAISGNGNCCWEMARALARALTIKSGSAERSLAE